MKKAGSSKSKSKTPPTSKSSRASKARASKKEKEELAGAVGLDSDLSSLLAESIAVGHQPPVTLSPKDEPIFRAFQANLLSLISHELRTPLIGILNALNALEQGDFSTDFSQADLVSMARRNAQRLQTTLSSLLDQAAIESGTFHARLREVDLVRLARMRAQAHESLLRDRNLKLKEREESDEETGEAPLLGDPQKLGRAIDLVFQSVIPRADPGSELQLRISTSRIALTFQLAAGVEGVWETAWEQASVGNQGGVASPTSAFAGVLQSEQGFLSRMEEGLGNEFLLVHNIMRLHRGRFSHLRQERKVTIALELPELSDQDGIRAVLASRTYQASHELGTVALALVKVPEGSDVGEFRAQVKRSLFRATDAVYSLASRGQVALVMDDCKPEDAPRLIARMEKAFGKKLVFGVANCPSEGVDPDELLKLAEKRLFSSAN